MICVSVFSAPFLCGSLYYVSPLIVLYVQSSDVNSSCGDGSQQDLSKGMK